MKQPKIMQHPDYEQIMKDLNNGESVRIIADKLRNKYPKNKKLWITYVTLQAFRKKHLKLDGKVLEDIKEATEAIKEQERIKKIEQSSSYQNKIEQIAEIGVDVSKKILQLEKIIQSRLEYWYNAIASGEETASKGDKELRAYMDKMFILLAQYKKFVEGLADKTVDYNININIMEEQVSIIRDVVRECITEMDPELAMQFMDKLSKRMSNISFKNGSVIDASKINNIPEAEMVCEGLVKK